jgi:hypothetical protein
MAMEEPIYMLVDPKQDPDVLFMHGSQPSQVVAVEVRKPRRWRMAARRPAV